MSQFGGGRNPVLEQVVEQLNAVNEMLHTRLTEVETKLAALEENCNEKPATKRKPISRSNVKPSDSA